MPVHICMLLQALITVHPQVFIPLSGVYRRMENHPADVNFQKTWALVSYELVDRLYRQWRLGLTENERISSTNGDKVHSNIGTSSWRGSYLLTWQAIRDAQYFLLARCLIFFLSQCGQPDISFSYARSLSNILRCWHSLPVKIQLSFYLDFVKFLVVFNHKYSLFSINSHFGSSPGKLNYRIIRVRYIKSIQVIVTRKFTRCNGRPTFSALPSWNKLETTIVLDTWQSVQTQDKSLIFFAEG